MKSQGLRQDCERLLAKRSNSPNSPQERETLPRHLRDVVETARALVVSIGERALESLGLRDTWGREMLSAAVERGAFLHDLGKANHQFQRMIRSGPHLPQALRHEWISVWLPLRWPELDQWLFTSCSEFVRQAALCAALGHHLDMGDDLKKGGDGSLFSVRSSTDLKTTVLCDHPDFHACLKVAHDVFRLPEPPILQKVEIDLLKRSLVVLRKWFLEATSWYTTIDADARRFVALVKGLVIAADVAGSALPRRGLAPETWVREVLGRVCTGVDLQDIAATRLAQHHPRPFQYYVAQSQDRVTFVKAGCGSGKTVAAYLWAAHHAAGRKLFICYPTTGTATEGYRGYLIPSEMTANARLLHSRSEVDLDGLLDTHGEDVLERVNRIEALATWDVPLAICTADQVLGLVQNNRRALFSLPPISNGAFVFDEIHQYDDRLFGALLCFLDAFRGAPILLMTASLQESRLRAIQNILHRVVTQLNTIDGPADLEGIQRYQLRGPVADPPWDSVEQTLRADGKVLWVANTVDRSRAFAAEAERRGFAPLLYHSRYRYCDRVHHHNAVVAAFDPSHSKATLAITTQVCEVSLDLSADLLVSDLAPVPALIQRLGRLNRRVTPENPGLPCPAVFVEPGGIAPYDKEEFDVDTVREWVRSLADRSVSQSDLMATFEQGIRDRVVPPIDSAWLDGGPRSQPAPLREAGVTIAVIRAEDEPACMDEKGRPISKEITRYTIPMTLGPVAKEIGGWKRLGFVFVVPSWRVDYSEKWGAQWAKK